MQIFENVSCSILARNHSIHEAELVYSKEKRLLVEIVDYGAQLLLRAFESSAKKIDDVIILPVFFKHYLAILDSAEILITNGASYAAQILARSLLETSFFIEWILKKDCSTRAMLYYVGYYRSERNHYHNFCELLKTDPASIKSIEKGAAGFDLDIPSVMASIISEINNLDKLLKSEKNAKINSLFDPMRKKTTKQWNINWYEPAGTKSLNDMAKEIGRLGEYFIYYRSQSKITHNAVILQQIEIEPTGVFLKPIRHLECASSVISQSASTTIRTYYKIIERYRPGELASSFASLAAKWNNQLKEMKSVEYYDETGENSKQENPKKQGRPIGN